MSAIEKIFAREIIDSRGTPTVEVEVYVENTCSIASVPSGASTGTFEAHELRDNDKKRFFSKGVSKAVNLINTEINETILGMNVTKQKQIDETLIKLDGTLNKSTTNEYTDAKRIVAGNPLPEFIFGLTNTLNYKNFDFTLIFQGEFGASIYNSAGRFQSANGDWFDNQTKDQLNRWQNPGDETDVPQARLGWSNGTGHSTRYLEEGDYVVCAVSGKKIYLENLNYWNVELQEPYFSYVEAFKKREELKKD